MNEELQIQVKEVFQKIENILHLKIKDEVNDNNVYMIEYTSTNFVIRLEKYYREIYASLYKKSYVDDAVDLFNLLVNLKNDAGDIIFGNPHLKEKDLQECYRMQLEDISKTISNNLDLLNKYFSDTNYDLRHLEVVSFWRKKAAELKSKP